MASSSINWFSRMRKACPDIEGRHKKTVYCSRNNKFIPIADIAVLLQRSFPDKNIRCEDSVCKNCYQRLISRFRVPSDELVSDEEQGASACSSQFSVPSFSSGEVFEPVLHVQTAVLNKSLRSKFELNISPLLIPSAVKEEHRAGYMSRKRKQIVESVSAAASNKLVKLYDVQVPIEETCIQCGHWITKFNSAFNNCTSMAEKIRLLSILPEQYPKADILVDIPGTTKYMIDQARKITAATGVYQSPDPYSGHELSNEIIELVQEYYLNDVLDCSRQSPYKSDVKTVLVNGEKVKKVKRYLTRSIQEIFHTFSKQHSLNNIRILKLEDQNSTHYGLSG